MSVIDNLIAVGEGLDPQEILNSARSRILSSSKYYPEGKFKQLENYLNNIIYNQDNQHSDIASRLGSAAVEYLNQDLTNRFEAYDFEKNIAQMGSGNSGLIPLNERVSFSHSKSIELNTIKHRIEQAKTQLESLNASDPNLINNFDKTINGLQQLINVGNQLLTQAAEGVLPVKVSKSGIASLSVSDKSSNLIKELDELYSQLTFMAALPLTVQETGEIFERSLQVVGSGKQVEELTDEVLREGFRSSTAGSQVVSRGGLINVAGFKVDEIPNKGKSSESISYQVTGDDGSEFKITGVFSAKQGKMDVLFVMPDDPGTQFRISAKNWTAINSSRDFGETDLLGALMRSAGLNPTLGYGIQVGMFRRGRAHEGNNVHQYAKVAILLDVLMGYSQESAYADTVVINDRANRKIRVFSMMDILNKALDNLDKYVLGYKPGAIKSGLRTSVDFHKPLGQSGKYPSQLGQIISALSAFKMRVGTGVLS